MKAQITEHLCVLNFQEIGGEKIAEVTCRDYDHYQSLPQVVMIENELFGLTGWNSDTQKACYKNPHMIAHSVELVFGRKSAVKSGGKYAPR